jgi:hypothetical protein
MRQAACICLAITAGLGKTAIFDAKGMDDQSNTDPGYWCCASNCRWLRTQQI